MLTMDKPNISEGLPPDLPIFLQKKFPKKPVIIIPEYRNLYFYALRTGHPKYHTLVYHAMNRISGEGLYADNLKDYASGTKSEVADSHSLKYKNWLETYVSPDGILPHIAYGGRKDQIDEGDFTLYRYPEEEWVMWAKIHFGSL